MTLASQRMPVPESASSNISKAYRHVHILQFCLRQSGREKIGPKIARTSSSAQIKYDQMEQNLVHCPTRCRERLHEMFLKDHREITYFG